jgi:hypothetical protein
MNPCYRIAVLVLGVVAFASVMLSSVAFAQESGSEDIRVISFEVSPDAITEGDTVVVTATAVNFATSTSEAFMELEADEVVVDSQQVRLGPQESKDLQLSFVASSAGQVSLSVGGITQTITVSEKSGGVVRVGPTVRLAANRTVVTESEDALIDLFWDNSELNDVTMRIEILIQVPIGLYIYSEVGAMACAAGTCKGIFDAPPGSVRNLPIIVKADRVGEYFISMNGRYWPSNDPDRWNPINLTTPIIVKAASSDPQDPAQTNSGQVPDEQAPSPTTQPQSSQTATPAEPTDAPPDQQGADSMSTNGTPWWGEPTAIVGVALLAALIAIVVIVIVLRPSIDIGPFRT